MRTIRYQSAWNLVVCCHRGGQTGEASQCRSPIHREQLSTVAVIINPGVVAREKLSAGDAEKIGRRTKVEPN